MKKAASKKAHGRRAPVGAGLRPGLTKRRQMAELKSLAALPSEAIDTSDAPELLDWSDAKRGLFSRPMKQQLTLRLDTGVVAWFKTDEIGSRIPNADQPRLTRHVERQVRGETRGKRT
jgi:uncharacterized protein (DUF4415 family)